MLRVISPLLVLVFASAISASAATPEDVAQACESLHRADAIFVGRPQTPTSINVSFEHLIEPARQKWLKAKEEASRSQQDIEVQIRAVKANDEYNMLRAQYPQPMDMVLIPIHVDARLKGETPDLVYMSAPGPKPLETDRPYLFFTHYMMEMWDKRLLRPAGLPKPVEEDDAVVQFVREATSATRGGVVFGWIVTESAVAPDGSAAPAPGVDVRVEAPGFMLNTATDSRGVFMVTEAPAGPVTVRPALHERLTIVHGSLSATVQEGGCVPFNLRAAVNGRIRGRVIGRDGQPKADLPVQLLIVGKSSSIDYVRFLNLRDRLKTRTNAKGEFEFRALPPGQYLLGHNLYPERDFIIHEAGANPVARPPTFYPGTSDRASAIPIVVGEGTDHGGLDFAVAW